MRSTILRLERRIQEQHQNALVAAEDAYSELAASCIQAARETGYLGGDPLGALAHLGAPRTDAAGLGPAVVDLWRTFFASFRADEAQFEAAQFEEQAADLNRRVEELSPGEPLDPAFIRALLDTLLVFWEERTMSVSQRLDHLIDELNQNRARLEGASLDAAHQQDEIARATGLVATALVELGMEVATDANLSQLLSQLVKRWREEFARLRTVAQEAKQQHQAFMTALEQAATGERPEHDQEVGRVTGRAAQKVVREVADLVHTTRLLEKDAAGLQARVAEAETENERLRAEVANRDRLIARYELGAYVGDDEDERLQLYRRALKAVQAGRDAGGLLERIRDMERVIQLSAEEEEQAMRLLDTRLDEAVNRLRELRRIMPLAEDPRRFRPRLLKSSPYRLKTLRGLSQAMRDAARDVLQYADRVRWVQGVQVLVREFDRLRKIFGEMVRLVADCRERVGGAPPMSLSISLDTSGGIASLPKLLALDVQALARRRGAAKMAHHVVPLCDEITGLFHDVLERATGEPIERPQPPARESATKALNRLADELLALDGVMTGVFAEAQAAGWQLSAEEIALAEQPPLVGMALEAVDGGADVLAVVEGAPPTAFTRIPRGKRPDSGKLLACARERVTWLEDVAAYRFEIVG